jgi:hypothetical protein
VTYWQLSGPLTVGGVAEADGTGPWEAAACYSSTAVVEQLSVPENGRLGIGAGKLVRGVTADPLLCFSESVYSQPLPAVV